MNTEIEGKGKIEVDDDQEMYKEVTVAVSSIIIGFINLKKIVEKYILY